MFRGATHFFSVIFTWKHSAVSHFGPFTLRASAPRFIYYTLGRDSEAGCEL
jgi:hypothetical protein